MQVRIKLENADELLAALRRLGSGAEQALETAAREGAEVVRAEANRLAPGPHIQAEVVQATRRTAVIDVGPDKDHWYYRFLETGTRPHTIRPSTRQSLLFEAGGEAVFARAVRHPGIAAEPFMRPALDENTGRAADAMGRTLRRRLGI